MCINAQTALLLSCVVQCVESICLDARDVATCQTTPIKPRMGKKSVRQGKDTSSHAQPVLTLRLQNPAKP